MRAQTRVRPGDARRQLPQESSLPPRQAADPKTPGLAFPRSLGSWEVKAVRVREPVRAGSDQGQAARQWATGVQTGPGRDLTAATPFRPGRGSWPPPVQPDGLGPAG